MDRHMVNHEMMKQPISFIGGENGMCSFTDLDALTEYKGKYLMIAEVKKIGNQIPPGQRIAIDRLVDRWVAPMKEAQDYNNLIEYLRMEHNDFRKVPKQIPELDAWGFRVTHNQPKDQIIYLMDCIVEDYYHKGKWKELKTKATFREVYNLRLEKWGLKKK